MGIAQNAKRLLCALALLALTAGVSIRSTGPIATQCGDSGDVIAAPRQDSRERFRVEIESCLGEMHEAMRRAMRSTSGGPDAIFAATMIAHHEGAIAMAKAELRYGRNEQLRRLAQEIIVTQQQEIAVMRLTLAHSPTGQRPESTR